MKLCGAARNSLPGVSPQERTNSLDTWGGTWLMPTARGKVGGTGLAASIGMVRPPSSRGGSVLLFGQADDQTVELGRHCDLAGQACVGFHFALLGRFEQIPLCARGGAADFRKPGHIDVAAAGSTRGGPAALA